jgi:hypothetical protein
MLSLSSKKEMKKRKLSSYRFIRFWQLHQFKIIVFSCILCICIAWCLKDKNETGTWSLEYDYSPEAKQRRLKRESKGEQECRRVMEKLFSRPFPCTRPAFLLNHESGRSLEIDCCNLDLMLGVEYNGLQHYQFVKVFHKTFEDFQKQVERDQLKYELCSKEGFTLIVVPYTITPSSIENYLTEELKYRGWIE